MDWGMMTKEVTVTDLTKEIVDLKAELVSLKHQLAAEKAGYAAALAAISAAFREIPSYDPKIMEAILTHCLKHGWPLEGIPDNELTETAYSGPLRFLLNDQAQVREFFRQAPSQ